MLVEKLKEDHSSQIAEDVKYVLFDDRDFDLSQAFGSWVGENTFTIKDNNGTYYKITVEKE